MNGCTIVIRYGVQDRPYMLYRLTHTFQNTNNAKSRATSSTTSTDEREDSFITEGEHNGENNMTHETQSNLLMNFTANIPSYDVGFSNERSNSTATENYLSAASIVSHQFQHPSMHMHYNDDQTTTRLISHGPADVGLLQCNNESNFALSSNSAVAALDLYGMSHQYLSPSPRKLVF